MILSTKRNSGSSSTIAAAKRLGFVKFQNIQNMQFFFKDNQGGEETTQVDYFSVIGNPISTTNMNDFKRVAGKKGTRSASGQPRKNFEQNKTASSLAHFCWKIPRETCERYFFGNNWQTRKKAIIKKWLGFCLKQRAPFHSIVIPTSPLALGEAFNRCDYQPVLF